MAEHLREVSSSMGGVAGLDGSGMSAATTLQALLRGMGANGLVPGTYPGDAFMTQMYNSAMGMGVSHPQSLIGMTNNGRCANRDII